MNRVLIVFEHDNGFVPEVIRRLTQSEVNHVGIVYDSEDWKAPWVFEAVAKGVRACPVKNRKWTRQVLVKYDIAPDIRTAAVFIGQPYDVWSLLAFGWVLCLWRFLRVKVRFPWKSAKGQFCSELVARVLAHGGKMTVANPQWVTPEEILEAIEKDPANFEVVQE